MLSLQLDKNKYPRGVFVMFFIQAISMVAFSFVMYLLVLYCTNSLHLSDDKSYSLNAAYIALMYAAHVCGGYIGEKFFGYRRSVTIGTVISIFGLFLLVIPSKLFLLLGLSGFVVGSGLLIPCSFVLLGRIYHKGNPARETGFVLSYIGMNVGSFFACALAGPLQQDLGFSIVFFISAIAQIFLLIYYLAYKHVFKEVAPGQKQIIQPRTTRSDSVKGYFYSFLCFIAITILLDFSAFCNELLLILGLASVILVVALALREQGQARKNFFAFLILTIIALVFWSLYMLSGSALTIFIERNVDRHVFHWLVPTASYSSLNPFFIMVLGPFMGILWTRLAKWTKQQGVSIPVKFGLGLIFMGLGFLILVWGISTHNPAGLITTAWIVASYLLQTIGELMVGPVGFSMVGNLVPARMEAFMVGIWELSSGIAGTLSGYLAQMTTSHTHQTAPLITDVLYSKSFFKFGFTVAIIGVAVLLFAKPLSAWAKTKTNTSQ